MKKSLFPKAWLLVFMAWYLFVITGVALAQDNDAQNPVPDAEAQATIAGPQPELSPDAPETVSAPADQNATEPDQAPVEVKNRNNQTYRDWLEHYGAWDKLGQVYAEEAEGPEAVLKRADIAMQGGNPAQALDLLEKTPPFEEKPFEIRRLWMGGQAQRALGDPARAVLWFSQAAKLMDAQEMRSWFNKEPNLHEVWADVWRKLFWVYANNSSVSQESQALFLSTILDQATTVWGRTTFWTSARTTFDMTLPETEENPTPKEIRTNILPESDRLVLARYLAEAALGRADALATLDTLDNVPLRLFWEAADSMASEGSTVTEVAEFLSQKNYFKAASFLERQANIAPLARMDEQRLLTGSPALDELRRNMAPVPQDEILRLFANGNIQGLMGPDAPPARLDILYFALALEAGDTTTAMALWPQLAQDDLPPTLLLAGIILSGKDAGAVRNWHPGTDPALVEALSELAQAGGAPSALPHEAPFWTAVDPARLTMLARMDYPLDPDLLLAYWTQEWSEKPSPELARRVAFLFPEDNLGALCTLYLAQHAVADRQLNLAAYYLDTVRDSSVNATLEAKRYEVTAEWQMAEEDMDGALASYEKLVATGVDISDVTRLKIAFLLQRKGRLEEGRDQLLKLWQKKDEMDTAMQAEIMFYLGEGEQAMGNSDTALDYFLNLAWEYPQESMWALTAMYRAANIYESREQYEPARKLLKTVIKNAQTDKQKAAAEARLADIEARMGKPSDLGAGSVPYPF